MAKVSMIEREKKRKLLVEKYAEHRSILRAQVKNGALSLEERMRAQEALQKLPRDSAKVRMRNRCAITGRPHGYYRKFGLGRNKLRELASVGDVPGIMKASW